MNGLAHSEEWHHVPVHKERGCQEGAAGNVGDREGVDVGHRMIAWVRAEGRRGEELNDLQFLLAIIARVIGRREEFFYHHLLAV